MRALRLAPLLVAGVLSGCSGDPDDPGDDEPPVALTTWYQDVGPMIATSCTGCHQATGIAPFSLTDYEYAAEIAPRLLDAVETGLMPPWDAEASADCAPTRAWKQNPQLSPEQIDLIRAWIADGTPAGEPVAMPLPPDTSLQGVTDSVAPSEGYVTSGPSDEFICFLMQPQITGIKWMTGIQVRPGNPDVVHHAVMSGLFPGPELDALVAANGIGVGFDCSAGAMMATDDTYLLGVWTPGNQPMQTAETMSIPIVQGGAVMMQIHYHPAGNINAPDTTTVDLRLTDTWPQKIYSMLPIGNAFAAPQLLPGSGDTGGVPEFRIPAGVAGHTERMRMTLPDLGELTSVPLFAAFPHMHYIGTDLSVKVERAQPSPTEPANECLVNVENWNFEWQRTYQYDAEYDQLPVVRPGDTIEVDCVYDNTLANPFVQRALEDAGLSAPIDVVLGEETLDEMCLGIMGIVVDAPPQQTARLADLRARVRPVRGLIPAAE